MIYNYLFPLAAVPWVLLRACNFCGNTHGMFTKAQLENNVRKKKMNSYLLLSEGGIMRPWDLRMCTSLTLHARERRDRFLRSAATTPLTLILHIYNINKISVHFSFLRCSTMCRTVTIVLTTRSICKRRLYMTILLRDAMIDAIGHVLELPVAVVPATFIHDVLRGVCAYCSCALQLATILVHLDRSFLPCLLLSRWQFPPLKRK